MSSKDSNNTITELSKGNNDFICKSNTNSQKVPKVFIHYYATKGEIRKTSRKKGKILKAV